MSLFHDCAIPLRRGLAFLCLCLPASLFLPSRAGASTVTIGSDSGTAFGFSLFGNSMNGSGGNLQPAALDGLSLPYLYRLTADVSVDITGTHDASVSTSGIYNGTPVNNAGEVSWLLSNLASTATLGVQQSGLQAAIWQVIYGSNFALNFGTTHPAIIQSYFADLAALGNNTAPLSDLVWITLQDSRGGALQGVVGVKAEAVPEPSTMVLASLGLCSVLAYSRRRLPRGRDRA